MPGSLSALNTREINGEKTFSVRCFTLTILKFFHYSFTTLPQERMSSFFGKVLAKKALQILDSEWHRI